MKKLPWGDLQLVLLLSRAGSFAAAAEQMAVSTPTIFRHANELEKRLGTLVFQRDTTGVSLTSAGRELAALAERIEEDVGALEVRLANSDTEPAGVVRLASVDTLIAGPLMPVLAGFRQAHPAILVDLRSGIGMADFRRREVDAALRAGGEPPDSLVGRRLCRIEVAVYGQASRYAAGLDTLSREDWVVPGDELGHLASAKWLKNSGYWARKVLQVNSLLSLSIAVAEGMGLGVLPCYLADPNDKLVRLGPPIGELASDLWFLTHSELRHTARIRTLSDYLAQEYQALRPLFSGELGGPE